MPIVCIHRPNRKTKRVFTENDLERIARNLIDGGSSRQKLLSSVSVATDNVYLLCLSGKALKVVIGSIGDLADIETLGTLSVSIKAAIFSLDKYGRKLPVVGRFVNLIIQVLKLFDVILTRLLALSAAIESLKLLQEDLEQSCLLAENRVKELVSLGKEELVGLSDLKNLIGVE